MNHMPDLPAATSDAARWELEFTLDPGANASRYARALNSLALAQKTNGLPDAAVASFLRADDVLGHATNLEPGEKDALLMNVMNALTEHGDHELALDFATRAVDNLRASHDKPFILACALVERARILRRFDRTDEELDLYLEALALLAFPLEAPEGMEEDAERVVAMVGQRVAELVGEERP
jgi:hypothetical protein